MPFFRSCVRFCGFVASCLSFSQISASTAVPAVQHSVAVVDIDEGVVSLLQHSAQKWQKGRMNAWRREVAAAALDPQYVSEHPPAGQEKEYLIEEAAMQLREDLDPKKRKSRPNGMGMGMGMGMGQSKSLADESPQSNDQHVMKDAQKSDVAFSQKASAGLGVGISTGMGMGMGMLGGRPHANLVEEAATRMREQLVQGMGMGIGTGTEARLSALQLDSRAHLSEHQSEASRHTVAAVHPPREFEEDASVSVDANLPRESTAHTLEETSALATEEKKHTEDLKQQDHECEQRAVACKTHLQSMKTCEAKRRCHANPRAEREMCQRFCASMSRSEERLCLEASGCASQVDSFQ